MPKRAKKVSLSAMRGLAIQALLIVFSVLLALFLHQLREQQQVTADLQTAYQNLRTEIGQNRDTLAARVESHRHTMAMIDSLSKENKGEITAADAALNGLYFPELRDAAWTTLHSTGLTKYLKFNDLYPLTNLYQLQESTQIDVQVVLRDKRNIKSLYRLFEQEKRLLAGMNTVLDAGQNWRYIE
jgi:hypothetical protein